jgi:general secretion pathway protein F
VKAYGYVAYTDAGRRRTGTVVAETETHAARKLQEQGLYPSELTARARRAGSGGLTRARLSPDLQAVMTRQMAVLLAADMPAEGALEAVRAGGTPALDRVAASALAALMDGAPLSEALERSGAGFPRYYIASVKSGETAGDAARVFAELADYLEGQGLDRAQISTALIYPAFVAAVSLLVCAILMVNVAPEIVAMFELSGRPLPQLTQNMLAVTDWIGANRWLLGGVGVMLIALAVAARFVPPLRQARDRIALRLPVIGRLMRLGASVQYMRTLALVLASRQPVVNACISASEVMDIARFRTEAEEVTQAVQSGDSLSDALGRLSPLPPVARQLISAGEASARLASMTGRAAMLVENSLSTERKRIAALLEPALMMVVGAMVLVIVLSILLPIFDLQAVVAG